MIILSGWAFSIIDLVTGRADAEKCTFGDHVQNGKAVSDAPTIPFAFMLGNGIRNDMRLLRLLTHILTAYLLLAARAEARVTVSSFSLVDNVSESPLRFREDDGSYNYLVFAIQKTTLQVTVKLSEESLLDLENINPYTSVFISLGDLNWSGSLGSDPSYTYDNMATKRSIYVRTQFDPFTGRPVGSDGVKLSWSATQLTISITSTSTGSNPFVSPLASSLIVRGASASPARAVNTSIPLDIQFDSVNLYQKKVFLQGSYAVKTQTVAGQVYNLQQISLTGAADLVSPAVTVNVPNRGIAEPGQQVRMTGKVTDTHGIRRIGITENGIQRELTQGVTTIKGPPSGASANWWGQVEKTFEVMVSPSQGPNDIVIWSEDLAGNRTEKTVRLIVALPTSLTGRWDTFISGGFIPGYLTLQVTPQGRVTGSLRMKEMVSAKNIVGVWRGERFDAWADQGKSSQMYVFGQISSGADISVTGVRLQVTVATDDGVRVYVVGTGEAFRAPFSASNKLSTNSPFLGRFHGSVSESFFPLVVGTGYFSMVTTQAGVNTVTGRLADGTSMTGAGIVGASGQAHTFVSLYNNKGCVLIESSLQDMTATPYWSRPPLLPDRQFPLGVEVAGGSALKRYSPPVKNQRILGLSTADARASWKGNGVSAPGIDQMVLVSLENKITPNGSSPDFKATFTAATGIITGSFKLPTNPAVVTSFSALVVGDQAEGYYVAPGPVGVPEKRYGTIQFKAPPAE